LEVGNQSARQCCGEVLRVGAARAKAFLLELQHLRREGDRPDDRELQREDGGARSML